MSIAWVHAKEIPFETRFKGVDKFNQLVETAEKEEWAKLPIGDRVIAVAKSLVGTPYLGFTLEIDDHTEAPSVNLDGLDCWTFFEDSLAFARMLELPPEEYTPETMLDYIELDRYRSGKCDGNYLSRLHYLEDWLYDNMRGGLVRDITRSLGGVRIYRDCREMSVGWHQYRYLRKNPSLREGIRKLEARISNMEVYHIPKDKVHLIEPQLQNGDIICITSNDGSGYTSHVGLAYRDENGVIHFMHASSNYHKVVIDKRLSDYLQDFRYHAGIYVARPLY